MICQGVASFCGFIFLSKGQREVVFQNLDLALQAWLLARAFRSGQVYPLKLRGNLRPPRRAPEKSKLHASGKGATSFL